MKLLIATAVLFVLLILTFLIGLASANPGITMLSFCSLSLFGNPLLWVAIYRVAILWGRKYQVVPRRG